jgi:hypothetical protein
VVKAGAVIGIADVHSGPFAHGLEPLQHLDFAGIVGVFLGDDGAWLHNPEILAENEAKKAFFCFVFQLLVQNFGRPESRVYFAVQHLVGST